MTASTTEQETTPAPSGDTGVGDGPPPSAMAGIERAGAVDGWLQVLAIEPEDKPYEGLALPGLDWEPEATTSKPSDHLDSRNFVQDEHAKALASYAQPRVNVTLPDGMCELPHDSPAELRDLIEDVYLFDGHTALQAVHEELRQIVRVARARQESQKHVGTRAAGAWASAMGLVDNDATAGGVAATNVGTTTNVAGLAEAQALYDRLIPRIGSADVAQATAWQRGFDTMLQ